MVDKKYRAAYNAPVKYRVVSMDRKWVSAEKYDSAEQAINDIIAPVVDCWIAETFPGYKMFPFYGGNATD